MEKTLLQDIMEFAHDCNTGDLEFQLTSNLAFFLESFIKHTSVDDYKKMKKMIESGDASALLLDGRIVMILSYIVNCDAELARADYLPPFAAAGEFLGSNLAENLHPEDMPNVKIK